jgi:hypothetical protein
MISRKTNVELPSSVTVAFFGILLIFSLILNVGIFLKLQEAPSAQDALSSSIAMNNAGTLKKKVEDGKVWVELPDPIFDAFFLTDATCSTCVDIENMKENFEVTYPTADTKVVDVSDPKGQEFLEAGVTVVPAIILSRAFQNTTTFDQVANAGIIAPVGERYFEYRTNGNKKILSEQKLPSIMRGKDSLMIVGYTDFFSPESAAFSTVVPQIAQQISPGIQVYNNAFVTDVPSAYVAEAVQCGVEMQDIIDSREEYVAAINEVTTGKQNLTQEDFDMIAEELKDILDISGETEKCYDKHEYLPKVQAIAAEAQSLGISGAPAYFVGNRFLAGPQTAEVFDAAIRESLTEMKGGANIPLPPSAPNDPGDSEAPTEPIQG